MWSRPPLLPLILFFFNDTATTEIYTLSLHDALPISTSPPQAFVREPGAPSGPRSRRRGRRLHGRRRDRKSTRLNSSHQISSYAVFCLKKKKKYTKSLSIKKKKKTKIK